MKSVELILWEEILADLSLQAGMLIIARQAGELVETSVVSAMNIPVEPFNGNESYSVRDVVKEIRSLNRKPHEHGIKNFALSNLVKRLGRNCHVAANAIYCEEETVSGDFVFLGFPKDNKRDASRPQRVAGVINPLIQFISQEAKLQFYEAKLDFTEKYMREVGHDLASCTQAIFAQLTSMRDGRIHESAMRHKAGSILEEVKNFYGIAETLNFTLDRDYRVQSRDRIAAGKLLEDIAEQYRAEANEKGIILESKVSPDGIYIMGDRPAVRQCVIHLVVNAIKYSFDNTTVSISCKRDGNEIHIIVSNRGLEIPTGPEGCKIWDFGYRSEYAKERHVNGSGIGLYTAKKIVIAHGGRIWNERSGGVTRFVIAFPF